jgi:hypothetical protein
LDTPPAPSPDSGSVTFRQIRVPETLVRGFHAVSQSVLEDGHSPEDVSNLLLLMRRILSHRVPLSDSLPAPALARHPLLQLLTQLKGLRSDLELRMLMILTDAGIASHFHSGCKVAVRYPDRCAEDEIGYAYPDLYCRRPRLAIFCDSEEFHSSPDARARDHGVSLALQLRGDTVLRFTGTQIRKSPITVGRMILAAFSNNPPKKQSSRRRDAA